MNMYQVTIKTCDRSVEYSAVAASSMDAWAAAADAQGDTPCGITVLPAGAQ